MLRIKCSVCRVEHRVVERKDVEGTKKGEERERRERQRETVGENVARGFAWLCSIILLLYLSCLRRGREKSGKGGTQGWRGSGYFITRWEEFFACEYDDRRNAVRMKLPCHNL